MPIRDPKVVFQQTINLRKSSKGVKARDALAEMTEGELARVRFASPCRDSSSEFTEEESNQHSQEILINLLMA